MSISKRLPWMIATSLGLGGISVPAPGQEALDPREISYPTPDGGVIFANDYGQGARAVLLAHGAVFDKESWDPLATRLAAAGFRVLAIDFRGYGQSRGGRARGALHEDVLAGIQYLRGQGAERVSLIGASMGGGAVGDAAAEAPAGAIDGLILLAAAPARAPGEMRGRKLFVVSSGDGARRSVQRQYAAARGPKTLTILPGSAHAQHIFRTDGAEALTQTILTWLLADDP